MNHLQSILLRYPPELLGRSAQGGRESFIASVMKDGSVNNAELHLISMLAGMNLYIALRLEGISDEPAIRACRALGESLPAAIQQAHEVNSKIRNPARKTDEKLADVCDMLTHAATSALGYVSSKTKRAIHASLSLLLSLYTKTPILTKPKLNGRGMTRRGKKYVVGGASFSQHADWLTPSSNLSGSGVFDWIKSAFTSSAPDTSEDGLTLSDMVSAPSTYYDMISPEGLQLCTDTAADAASLNAAYMRQLGRDAMNMAWQTGPGASTWQNIKGFAHNNTGALLSLLPTGWRIAGIATALGAPLIKKAWQASLGKWGQQMSKYGSNPKSSTIPRYLAKFGGGVLNLIGDAASAVENFVNEDATKKHMEELDAVASALAQGIGADMMQYQQQTASYQAQIQREQALHKAAQDKEREKIRQENEKVKEAREQEIRRIKAENAKTQAEIDEDKRHAQALADDMKELIPKVEAYEREMAAIDWDRKAAAQAPLQTKNKERIAKQSARWMTSMLDDKKFSKAIEAAANEAGASGDYTEDMTSAKSLLNEFNAKQKEALKLYKEAEQAGGPAQAKILTEKADQAWEEALDTFHRAGSLVGTTTRRAFDTLNHSVSFAEQHRSTGGPDYGHKNEDNMFSNAFATIGDTVLGVFSKMPAESRRIDAMDPRAVMAASLAQKLQEGIALDAQFPTKVGLDPRKYHIGDVRRTVRVLQEVPEKITDDSPLLKKFIETPFTTEAKKPIQSLTNTMTLMKVLPQQITAIEEKYKKKKEEEEEKPYKNPMPAEYVSAMDGRPSTLKTVVTPTNRYQAYRAKPANIGIPQSALQRSGYTVPHLIPQYKSTSPRVVYQPLRKKARL